MYPSWVKYKEEKKAYEEEKKAYEAKKSKVPSGQKVTEAFGKKPLQQPVQGYGQAKNVGDTQQKSLCKKVVKGCPFS